jgi:uncharacterized membrane protein YidH (DUF202 family)
MTINLRLSLTIFKIGFAAESASGFVALAGGAAQLPFHGYLVLLGPVFTALGILFLWVGRHEWNELHHSRVRHASLVFFGSLAAIALVVAPIAYLALTSPANFTGWLGLEFGLAIALVFGLTFVTYALVAAHLVGPLGRVAMAVGLAWSILVSAFLGLDLSPVLPPIARAILVRAPGSVALPGPVILLDALFAFSYLAFLIAFSDAHYRVARGLDRSAGSGMPA